MNSLPVLISYAYAKCFDWNKVKEVSGKMDLLIDCGAFTVHKKGKVIRLYDYMEFLWKIDYPIDGYFVLDSIGDPKKTFENFMAMRKAGFEPMPIFTRGDSLERLDEYYKYSDIIALGGLKAGGENDDGYIKWFMEKGVKGRKVHWLGYAKHDMMYHYKPYSVDAINWKRALLYGDLVLYTRFGFRHAKRRDFSKKIIPREILTAIRNLGYDPYKLKQEESWRGVHTYAHEISTASYLNYVDDVKKDIGTKFYFVCNAQHELDFLLSMI